MNRQRHKTSTPNIWYRLTPNNERRYIVRYVDGNLKEHTKTLPLGTTLEDAKVYQGRLHAKKADGDLLIPCRQTVGELLDDWLELRKADWSPNTYRVQKSVVKNHLKPYFGNRRLTELSPSHIAAFIVHMKQEGKKTWTVKQALNPLSGALRVAVRDGKIGSSPMVKLLPHERPKRDQKVMRCLSGEELSAVLSKSSNLRWRTLFAVLAFSGLRISEAVELTWDDITEDSILVRKSKTSAGVREVMLTKAVRSLLTELKLQQTHGATQVFTGPQGGSCDPREARRELHRVCDRAGIPRYTPHELRHTFASILISQGENIVFISKQMGHSSPDLTLRVYAHLFEAQASVDAARERLQVMAGGLI